MSTAINMFLKRVIYERDVPFEVKQQSSKEFEYMEKHPEEYKSFHSVKELIEDLNSGD